MRPALAIFAVLTAISVVQGRGRLSDDQAALTPAAATLSIFDISNGNAKTLLHVEHQFMSAPAIAGATAYIATSDKKVLALESPSGHIKWEYTTMRPVFSLLATEKNLFVGAGGTLAALDPERGTVRWNFENDMALSDPVLADGVIVLNSIDGPVAIDSTTGKARWRLPVQWGYFVFSPLSDHRLCVWKPDEIYVVDTESGKTLWQSSADNSVSAPGALPSPAVAAGDVICQLRSSRHDPRDWSLAALDSGSGKLLWKTKLGDYHGAAARTLIAGSAVYCVLDETVFRFDLSTGQKTWQAPTKPLDTNGGGMSAGSGALFLPQIGGNLLALDAKTGERKWIDQSTAPARKNTMRIAGLAVVGDSIWMSRNEFVGP